MGDRVAPVACEQGQSNWCRLMGRESTSDAIRVHNSAWARRVPNIAGEGDSYRGTASQEGVAYGGRLEGASAG